ncbi:glycosyltransferase family A protein [Methylocaldum sp.]|uniref:glycosyltransferase family 2 protein n=1 Tax=Methylocaldum sp. TaxID=1969727 RepID=UPI002D619D85|nr:glycosyltransferase family A protein [Methylocaldum sp.]HYE35255.1 glycosyltransferase family A protein [Methylocaldum sp.]
MSTTPLVSAITIFLNAEEFLEQAIQSVLAQTYSNWELLLVDDGSTDGSTAIAQQYARRYPNRMHYLEHEGHRNRGMSASRNLGVRKASGDLIALLDADDLWLPQKLEKQVAILQSHPEVGMVYGSTFMWYGWTGKAEDALSDRRRKLGVAMDRIVKPPDLAVLCLQGEAETPGTCSVLMRRSLVEGVGGFEESFRSMFEDQAFFTKVFLSAAVFVESGCWDRYRQHSKSSCYVAQGDGRYDPVGPNASQRIFLEWLERYLREKDVGDPEVSRALRTALLPYRQPGVHLVKQLFRRSSWRCAVRDWACVVLPDSIYRRLEKWRSNTVNHRSWRHP